MAKGFPDFADSFVSPWHGTFEADNYTDVLAVSAVTTVIHTLTGKGVVRGAAGIVYSDTADGDATYDISCIVDGATVFTLIHRTSSRKYVLRRETSFAKIIYADYDLSYVEWCITREIPFTTSFVVRIRPVFVTGDINVNSTLFFSYIM